MVKIGIDEMVGLENPDRRRFFPKALFAATGFTLAANGCMSLGGGNAREFFERDTPLDLESLAQIPVENTRKDHVMIPEEEAVERENLSREPLFSQYNITQLTREKVEAETYVRLEPDMEFADRLIREARISINHMVNFLGSIFVNKGSMVFEVPVSYADIRISNTLGAKFYLVADQRTRIITTYTTILNGQVVPITGQFEHDNPAGESTELFDFVATETGFDLDSYQSRPIFYRTSADIVNLIETPAIEYLHKQVRRLTLRNIETGVRNIDRTQEVLNRVFNLQLTREELFVHALSILWLRQYNLDRGLGLTYQELADRFALYGTQPRYQGVESVSKIIEQIGIGEAFNLYAGNSERLFEGIPNP